VVRAEVVMRRPHIATVLAVVTLVTATALTASTPSTAQVAASKATSPAQLKTLLARLQHHYKETDSFQANFKETLTRTGAPPRDRSGIIYYQRPGRLHWEFTNPQPETIVSDGSLIYDYDPGLNQVVETPVKNAFKSHGVAAVLLGVGNLSRDFEASPAASPPDDGLGHIVLTPKGGGDQIELGIDRQTFNIVTLGLKDSLGNRTELQFSAIQRNLPLDAKLFRFTVPAGADIVNSEGSQT
jgi:outer membrane lipoprotein carrier protein